MPRTASAHQHPRYSVHPGVQMVQDWIATLQAKTGRSLEGWLRLVEQEGPSEARARVAWLKQAHGLGSNAAAWIAERATGKGEDDPKKYLAAARQYVDAMYESKAALRPLHDALIELGMGLGDDVQVCPCKTIVPLYRNHVFAQVKPSTKTRIDLGFALGDTKASGRLIDTGGYAKKDRITHRMPISALGDIDAEVKRWLVEAYEMDA